ncbi:MAG TPA: glycosyltransferase [Candidatus Limnocylindrales bacterium]
MTEAGETSAGPPVGRGEAARPLLSVCVPTYGRPTTLARTLGSIEAGGLALAADVEVLVSDNSPDISWPVVEPILERWPGPTRYLANRPTISAQENHNQCIREASGRYILFLHDDDYLLPNGLGDVLDELRSNPDRSIYLFGVDVVDLSGRLRRRQRFLTSVDLSPRSALRRLMTDSSFVRMPVLVVERAAFDKTGGFDERVGNPADFDLLVRLFAAFGVRCVATTTGAYTIHVGSSTTGMFRRATLDVIGPIFDRAASTGLLSPAELRRCKTDWLHQFILGGAYRSLRGGDVDGARKILRLFRDPMVGPLGWSRRWLVVRLGFEFIDRLPRPIGSRLMRLIGRLSLERFWMH